MHAEPMGAVHIVLTTLTKECLVNSVKTMQTVYPCRYNCSNNTVLLAYMDKGMD